MQDTLPSGSHELGRFLEKADSHSVASALNRAPALSRVDAFLRLNRVKRHKVFGLLDPASQADIVEGVSDGERAVLLDEMEPDDRARLFARLPEVDVQRLLAGLEPHERRLTLDLLRYPPSSAGRIMSPEFVRLSPTMTVAEALDEVRRGEKRAETIYFLPVTDDDMRLVGAVDLAGVVLASPEQTIASITTSDTPAVRATEDQEHVARLMKEGDLMVVPVVDEDDRLVGIVTFDDAMEVLEFEESEDHARTGATEPIARPYMSVPILRLVRSRIVWLSVLAVAATLTVNVLGAFEETLAEVVSLALFIPLLIGIGGNTGAQSATTIVRALAVRDVKPRDALAIALREVATGLLMGIGIAIVCFGVVGLVFDWAIAAIVSSTLVAICGLAALVGSLMPLLAKRFSIDPAVFSAPFVTTIVDTSGLLIYFLLARAVLGL